MRDKDKPDLSQNILQNVRKYLFDSFLEQGEGPVLEDIMQMYNLSRQATSTILHDLETNRTLVLVPGTVRVYMVNPFSNVPTPFKVSTGGRGYFAASAVDAMGFHPMLHDQDTTINSYCHHCAMPLRVRLKNGKVAEDSNNDETIVSITVPARNWWDNIVNTCSNNMVFHASQDHYEEWCKQSNSTGETLSVGKTLEMVQPLFRSRLHEDFARPKPEELQDYWRSIGLKSEFWELR
jgi:hypothetical protein